MMTLRKIIKSTYVSEKFYFLYEVFISAPVVSVQRTELFWIAAQKMSPNHYRHRIDISDVFSANIMI